MEYYVSEYYTLNMPKIIYTKEHREIVSRLIKARIDNGYTQAQAAKKIGRTQSYLSKIESGQRRFDILQLKEFARLYNKEIDFFIK